MPAPGRPARRRFCRSPGRGPRGQWGPVRGLACDEGQADCWLQPGRPPREGSRVEAAGRGQAFVVLAATAGLVAHRRACHLSPGLPQVPADGGGQDTPSLLLQEPLLSCVPHCYAQEVSRLCHLPAGAYRIVPSTYLPDTEGAFTVTVETRIDRWALGLRGCACARGCVRVWGVSPALLPLGLSQSPAHPDLHLSRRARGLWEESRWAWSSLPPTPRGAGRPGVRGLELIAPHAPGCGVPRAGYSLSGFSYCKAPALELQ